MLIPIPRLGKNPPVVSNYVRARSKRTLASAIWARLRQKITLQSALSHGDRGISERFGCGLTHGGALGTLPRGSKSSPHQGPSRSGAPRGRPTEKPCPRESKDAFHVEEGDKLGASPPWKSDRSGNELRRSRAYERNRLKSGEGWAGSEAHKGDSSSSCSRCGWCINLASRKRFASS